MRRVWLGLLAAALGLTGGARPAQAQFRFGGGAAWGSDSDLGISARFLLGLGTQVAQRDLTGQFSAAWFVDACDFDCTYVEFTPAAFVPFAGTDIVPFAGAGLNLSHASIDTPFENADVSNTEIGLALLGGILFPIGSLTGQGEGRVTLGGSQQLMLSFSVLFGGGR
jgi:hypothetical protein